MKRAVIFSYTVQYIQNFLSAIFVFGDQTEVWKPSKVSLLAILSCHIAHHVLYNTADIINYHIGNFEISFAFISSPEPKAHKVSL